MPTHKNLILIAALTLPLALTACSHVAKDGGNPRASASGSASPSAATTPTFPIATVYQVTAKEGVTDKDLQDAVDKIAKLPGVQAASVNRKLHQVRVDLSAINITKNAPPVYHALEKLGTVQAI